MNRITILLVALFALLVGTMSTLQAQPQSVQMTATVEVQTFLTCAPGQNLNYGPHFRIDGVISSSSANYASLICTTQPGGSPVDVTFELPLTLNRNGGGGSVPILFKSSSAKFRGPNSTWISFDPSVGLFNQPTNSADGLFEVRLGQQDGQSDVTGIVTVDLTGAPIGVYEGTITANVVAR